MSIDVGLAIGAGIGVASVMGARVPASLRCVEPPNIGFVPFDFNPEKITMSRNSSLLKSDKPEPPTGKSGTGAGSRSKTTALTGSTIKLSKLTFTGLTTKWLCDQLLAWMVPTLSFRALLGRGGYASQPAPLTFQWGPPMAAFMYDCKLKSVSVVYTRFSAIGIPLRAEVEMELVEVPTKWGSMPTNPTSGGLPGRRTHVVAAGESLQSIAQDKYGTPGIWRRIAEVNNVVDPTRIRPGTTIYLPNPEELSGSTT